MAKKKRRKTLKKPVPIPIESKFDWDKFWKRMGYAATVVAILTGCFFAKDRWLKSDNEKQNEIEKNHSKQGELIPPKITIPKVEYYSSEKPFIYNTKFDNRKIPPIKGLKIKYYHPDDELMFLFGPRELVVIPIKSLLTGVTVNVHKSNGCDDTKFKFGIHNERLYISTEFKDLQQERTVGIIEYNHWQVFLDNYCTIHNDDKGFEVTDRQHYVVFTMKYELSTIKDSTNMIIIGGYFITPSSIRIIQNYGGGPSTYIDTCFSKSIPDWKLKSEKNISHIKTNFP